VPEQTVFPLKLSCPHCGDSALKIVSHHTHETGATCFLISCYRCEKGFELDLLVTQHATHTTIELQAVVK